MSNHVTSLLRRRNLGVGLTGKALILLMGDLASDDGSGIWASKPTMASELETSEPTVQRTIKDLINAGFVAEVGKRQHRNGFTYEYRIIVERVELCEKLRTSPPTQRHPSAQHVGARAQNIAPDRLSPNPRHSVTQTKINQIEPNARLTPRTTQILIFLVFGISSQLSIPGWVMLRKQRTHCARRWAREQTPPRSLPGPRSTPSSRQATNPGSSSIPRIGSRKAAGVITSQSRLHPWTRRRCWKNAPRIFSLVSHGPAPSCPALQAIASRRAW